MTVLPFTPCAHCASVRDTVSAALEGRTTTPCPTHQPNEHTAESGDTTTEAPTNVVELRQRHGAAHHAALALNHQDATLRHHLETTPPDDAA